MRLVVFLIALAVFATSVVAAPSYSLDDLAALDKQQSWQELFTHLSDIAPAKRTDPWNAMLERSAVGVLGAHDGEDGWTFADAAVKQYPALTRSKKFMAMRAQIGVHGIEACIKRAEAVPCNQRPPGDVQVQRAGCARLPDVSECVTRTLGFLDNEPADSEFGMAAARAIAADDEFAAVRVYRRALASHHDAKRCADPELAKAVTWTLNLAPGDARAEDARAIASELCWDQVKEAVVGHFMDHGDNYRRNTCPFLLAKKNALSPMSTRECQALAK